MARGEVPGLSIGIVYRDEVVFVEGYGVRETGQAETVSADTVFQLASVSKPLAATVVAALVSDGVVTWDTRIRDLDPDFALPDAYPTAQVTIRDLLSHRSGLAANAGNDIEDLGFSREEIKRVWEQGGKRPLAAALRCRVGIDAVADLGDTRFERQPGEQLVAGLVECLARNSYPYAFARGAVVGAIWNLFGTVEQQADCQR